MAAKLTAGACTHSCKPCSTSASEQDAVHAVHPDTSMASADSYNEANFPLPVIQNSNPSSVKDEQGSNLGDGPVSARSSQAAISEQKINGIVRKRFFHVFIASFWSFPLAMLTTGSHVDSQCFH